MANTKIFVNNLLWKFLERCGSQGVTIIVTILLARLIEPSAFGVMSIIYVFTAILTVFVDSGLGIALIQKKEADDVDFSSVFYFNVLFGILLYLLLFILAPFISSFYKMPELTELLRVASLVLVVSGLRNVQQAYVSRKMIFKNYFYSTLIGVLTSAVLALYLAYSGYGVWALVWQNLTNMVVSTTMLWIFVKWRPKPIFSIRRLICMIKYGWKLLVTGLLDILYDNIRVLIIGRLYKTNDLAFYNMGTQIPYGLVNNINASMDSVLLPTVSAEQDDKEQVKRMARRAIITSTYIMAPVMIFLAVTADNFVYLILTDKWAGCVPFLRVFCLVFMFYPINSANLNVIKALGRSDIILRIEILKKIIGICMILFTMWISPFAMAIGMLICALINQFINSWPNRKLLNYSYKEQLKDIFPNLLLSIVIAIVIALIPLLGIPRLFTFILQIIVAIALFVAFSKLFKVDSYSYVKNVLSLYRKN